MEDPTKTAYDDYPETFVKEPAIVQDYPSPPENGGYPNGTIKQIDIPAEFTSFIYQGKVYDSEDGSPIPYASVNIYAAGRHIAGEAADADGNFSLATQEPGQEIIISAVDYKTKSWPARDWQRNFDMQKDVQALPPVELPSGGKKNNAWLLLLLLIPVLAKKKAGKTVGKIDMSTIMVVVAGGIALLGFDTIKKLFESLGLWTNPDTKDVIKEVTDPGSPWSPNFWKAGPEGTALLRVSDMEQMLEEIKSGFSLWGDDEEKVIGVFKQLRTQSQLSFFADWFGTTDDYGKSGGDLLTWLRGSYWPPGNDRLSDKEINVIIQYINQLPQYTYR